MAHGPAWRDGKKGNYDDFLSPGRGDIIATGRVESLCRPPRRAHAPLYAARSHPAMRDRGPHYCAANAAVDEAYLRVNASWIHFSWPERHRWYFAV